MLEMTSKIRKAFREQYFPKFAATVDENGVPNVVPLLSATLWDDNTAIFVKFMIWKTAKNLESNGKVALSCIGPGFKGYYAKGRFEGYETSGEYVEKFSQGATFRYNAYMGATHVGVIKLEELGGPYGLKPLKGLLSGLKNRNGVPTNGADGAMPGVVREKFSRGLSVKFLGWADDQGFPLGLPCFGLRASGPDRICFPIADKSSPLASLEDGKLIAASVLAFEPVAYQVKGVFKRPAAEEGLIEVEEVFSASPPLPGEKIYPKKV